MYKMLITKVHPNGSSVSSSTTNNTVHVIANPPSSSSVEVEDAVVLTVWKRSLLFNCNGFTVYDAKGRLVYRVDNYMSFSGTHGEVVLMDAIGNALLTVRRKRLCLGDNWAVYKGETTVNPLLSARKTGNILNAKCLARVSQNQDSNKKVIYEIEGSYKQRSCKVYDKNKNRVVEIKKKEPTTNGVAHGGEVFRLVVKPEFDASVAMALVILLDQMFGSSKH